MTQTLKENPRRGGERRNKKSLIIFLAVLSVLFFLVLFLFVREYAILRHDGILRFHQLKNNALQYQVGSTTPVLISNVEMIENWMTFDYVNASFRLPQDVLRDALLITDPNYPHISIHRAAKERGISRDAYLLLVKAAIREYLLSHRIP